MDRMHMLKTGRTIAASALLALAGVQVTAADPGVVWVDNEHFGFTSCSAPDALPASQDPKELMSALRERGLADANRIVRARGFGQGTVTLTPLSGSIRCEGTASSSMVFRLASYDDASGRSWTSNLVTRLPAQGIPTSGLRSTR